jgi:hypothetical protein
MKRLGSFLDRLLARNANAARRAAAAREKGLGGCHCPTGRRPGEKDSNAGHLATGWSKTQA